MASSSNSFSARGMGAVLLSLVSRGQALIAELLRLADHVPPAFYSPRFAPFLFDFKYLKSPDLFEERIGTDANLLILDDDFRENCLQILERFYMLFHGIVKYYQDLLQYLEDLQDGTYVQNSIESILANEDGCQLFVEALTLHGILLLFLEHKFEGDLREKLIVAYSRCKGTTDLPNIDTICTLCRTLPPQPQSGLSSIPSFTPFFQSSVLPIPATMLTCNRAEDFFARLPLPKHVVSMVVERLQVDDIYHQIRHYPKPEHRWVALNAQAGCLYVLLYHMPDTLHNNHKRMQEIVEKFFKDNWVVPIFMGYSIDLQIAWDRFKAAKSSVGPTLTLSTVKDTVSGHTARVLGMIAELGSFLCEGVLTEHYVLKNIQVLVSCLRECNVTLRWLLLHRYAASRKLRELVISIGENRGVSENVLLLLFLDTSRLEFELKHLYGELLERKTTRWKECRKQASDCIQELADFFSGSQVLSTKARDDSLQQWFAQMAFQVGVLDYKDDLKTGRKVQQMISALREVEQFHQIEGNLQTKQHLSETRNHLQEMLRSLSVHESTLATISLVTDAAYAWGSIEMFKKQLRSRIQTDPSTVLKLQCLFVKLRSIMDIPLLRISQSESEDLFSVSEYYSSKLISFVRDVLEIIPVSIFSLLKDVMGRVSHQLYDLPVRMEKENLRDFAQLDDRYALARAAHQVSILSQGTLAMTRTFVGAFELDPRQLLEEGIGKQLQNELGHTLDCIFMFSAGNTAGRVDELEDKLHEAKTFLQSQQRIMEYFQDYMHVHGLHLWQEEFTRVISLSIQQELSYYTQQKAQDLKSSHESKSVSTSQVAVLGRNESKSGSFLGGIVRQLLLLTDPARSMYLAPMSGWFDAGGRELVGLRTFTMLKESLGAAGVAAIDRLISFEAASSLREAMEMLQTQMNPSLAEKLETFEGCLVPKSGLPDGGLFVYNEHFISRNAAWDSWAEIIAHVGRIQLLRCLISSQLHAATKVESGLISCALEGMSKATVHEIQKLAMPQGGNVEDNKPVEKLLMNLCKKLQLCGLNNPLQTIFITHSAPNHFALIVFIITIAQLPRYVLDNHLSTLASRMKKAALDFCPLMVGLVTLFHQFHPTYTAMYIQYLGQYVRTQINTKSAPNELHEKPHDNEVNKTLTWILVLLRFLEVPLEVTEASLPLAVLSCVATT